MIVYVPHQVSRPRHLPGDYVHPVCLLGCRLLLFQLLPPEKQGLCRPDHFLLIGSLLPFRYQLLEFPFGISQVVQLLLFDLVLQLKRSVMLLKPFLVRQLFVFRLFFLVHPDQLIQLLLLIIQPYGLPLRLVQHLVQLKVPAVGELLRPADDFVRQAAALRYGKGIGAARFAYGEFIKGFQPVLVKVHGAVDDTAYFACHHLKVQVVRSDDTYGALIGEPFHDSLGKRAAQVGIRTAAQLINKEQGLAIGIFQEKFHILKVGAIGAQLILYRLCVPDMYHDLPEDAHFRNGIHRDKQPGLQHQLQQAYRLHGYGLTAGIGS